MINLNDKETKVQFSKQGSSPTLALSVFEKKLIIQQTANRYTIGSKIPLDQIQDLPKVVLEFEKIESIDVMIQLLERVKLNLQADSSSGQFSLAC